MAGTHVDVYSLDYHADTDKARAEDLLQQFEIKIWPDLTGLMGRTSLVEPDKHFEDFWDSMPTDTEGRTT